MTAGWRAKALALIYAISNCKQPIWCLHMSVPLYCVRQICNSRWVVCFKSRWILCIKNHIQLTGSLHFFCVVYTRVLTHISNLECFKTKLKLDQSFIILSILDSSQTKRWTSQYQWSSFTNLTLVGVPPKNQISTWSPNNQMTSPMRVPFTTHTAWIWSWMAKRPGVTFDAFQVY